MVCGCVRILMGLTLMVRSLFHLIVAGFAAKDLYDMQQETKDTLSQFVLKFTPVRELAAEIKFPLFFFIACGVLLMLVSATFPLRDSYRGVLPFYAILHLVFMGMVVYVVYIRTIAEINKNDLYKIVSAQWFWPTSLALDLVSLLSAFVPLSTEYRPRRSYPGTVVYRD